jgi:hypothetical protein
MECRPGPGGGTGPGPGRSARLSHAWRWLRHGSGHMYVFSAVRGGHSPSPLPQGSPMKIVSARLWGSRFKSLQKASTLPALLVAFACTSATEPEPPPSVTLLVTNATCGSGQCSSFQVRGFPSNLPAVPAGPRSMDLGTVSTESACLTLPSADTFWINTTPSIWTSRDSLSLGILEPGQFWGHASPSTVEFVPANSAGWSVTLPDGTAMTPADVCG